MRIASTLHKDQYIFLISSYYNDKHFGLML